MKVTRQNSIIFLLIGTALLGFLWSRAYFFKQDTINITDQEPAYMLHAEKIISSIDNESLHFLEAEAIVEIEGIIKEVNYTNDRVTIFLRADKEEAPFVICDMQQGQKERVEKLHPGDTIRLKGMFKGYLKDAIFLNCVISEKNYE
ncbi:hypothetical protein ACFQ1M_05085 [Sungkyunkwania multivorans]|uniref:tRNA_anti-like n=1 Tax=Sungkyunkwania multivorans TaxID=1173618 RepID=A0ABW3CWN8_9FLAO